MNKSTVLIIIALIVVAAGWWWADSMKEVPPPVETGQVEGATDEGFVDSSKDGAAASVTVRYTAEGFVPSTVTVKKGTAVTFVNQGGGEMWVGSDEHPSHTGYAGTNKDTHCINGQPSATAFDQCGVTASYTFTFDKTGSWGYHNHRESDDHGTIVVTN